MTTFTWTIQQLQAIPQADGLEKIVDRIIGTLTATSDDELTTSQLINVKAGPYSAADFIPFDDLTEEVVIGWIEACLGEEQLNTIKAGLEQRIVEMRNLQLAPPWSN